LNPYGRKLTEGEVLELLADCDGVIAGTEPLTARVLCAAKRLKVISRCGAGLDNVDLQAALDLGILVTRTADVPAQAVAELTLGLILDGLRGISRHDRTVRAGRWKKSMGRLLAGKALGLLGLGRIGKKLVQLVQSFDLTYLAWDRAPDREFARIYGVQYLTLDAVLDGADIISLHLAYEPALRNLIGAREIDLMKTDALLVNTARGELVDEDVLYRALRRGRIGGAALDTFTQEPYTGPLRNLPNTVFTCHIGAYARETRVRMEMEAAENLMNALAVLKK
jgi:D-3-phosphoglycerate dehydrogenase